MKSPFQLIVVLMLVLLVIAMVKLKSIGEPQVLSYLPKYLDQEPIDLSR
ncbi:MULTISPECIES: hypothetical protein [unclassified Agarivorans]